MKPLREPYRSIVAAWEAAYPTRCWYWNAEPPYVPPCGRCRKCREVLLATRDRRYPQVTP